MRALQSASCSNPTTVAPLSYAVPIACGGQDFWHQLINVSLNLYHCGLIIDASFGMRQKLSGIAKIDEQIF